MRPEDAFQRVYGHPVPPVPAARGAYVPAFLHRGIVYVSGQTPKVGGEPRFRGRLGLDLDVPDGVEASRLAMANCIASIKSVVADLSRITAILQLVGYVQCTQDFERHTEVVDGASQVLVDVFGTAGNHTRTAIGVTSLPRGVAVELTLSAAVDVA